MIIKLCNQKYIVFNRVPMDHSKEFSPADTTELTTMFKHILIKAHHITRSGIITFKHYHHTIIVFVIQHSFLHTMQ